MINKLIFFLFVTLGITVIILCIYKSTKIEEHYKGANINYSDVILPCDKNELKKSYKINLVNKFLKKYKIDKSEVSVIKQKIKEKSHKNRICERALELILDTYLVYYKPIIQNIFKDLNKMKNKNFENTEADIEEEDESVNPSDKEEEEDEVKEEKQEDEEYDDENDSINCKHLNNTVDRLESDGFLSTKNKQNILNHYNKVCYKN